MKAILYLVTLLTYGVEVYHLTQHTEYTAHLLLWVELGAIALAAAIMTRLPNIKQEIRDLPDTATWDCAWWFAYFVAWLLHWPEPSSGILIGAAIFLGLRFAATRIAWLLP